MVKTTKNLPSGGSAAANSHAVGIHWKTARGIRLRWNFGGKTKCVCVHYKTKQKKTFNFDQGFMYK